MAIQNEPLHATSEVWPQDLMPGRDFMSVFEATNAVPLGKQQPQNHYTRDFAHPHHLLNIWFKKQWFLAGFMLVVLVTLTSISMTVQFGYDISMTKMDLIGSSC